MSARGPAIALSAALAACGGGGTSPATPAPTPTPIASPAGWAALAGSPLSPGTGRHDDVFFLDAANGWLVNIRMEVYGTHDAGASWEMLARFTDVTPRCVGFGSLTRGWLGNINFTDSRTDAALYETDDGGRSWSNISTRIQGATVPGLCGMRVLGSSVIVAVGRWHGPPVFVKSTDGGRSWTARNLAPLASGLVDLFFFNERDGFAVGGLGVSRNEPDQRASRTVILATSDGGETWERRYLSESVGEWAWKIHFVDDRVGFVTTEGPTPQGVVIRTTDGGASWAPVTVSPGTAFEGVGFVSRERGWVGAFDTLYQTTDGGTTWTPLHFGTRINRMRVLAGDLVYACGDRVYRWQP